MHSGGPNVAAYAADMAWEAAAASQRSRWPLPMEHSWSAGIWPLAQPPQAPLTAAAPVLGAGALQLAGPVPVTGSAVGVVGGTVTRTAVPRSGSSRTATCQRS